MNLESPIDQPLDNLLAAAVDALDAAIELYSPPTQLPDPSDPEVNEGEPESEADSAARFITLMLNTPDSASSPDFKPVVQPSLKYVQGVVHGQQAYLITNLLHGESQTLFQPQMVWTIGRNRDAALPLPERSLSRRHAVILYVPDQGFQLIDLNSMNGSFINDVRVQQRSSVKDGDSVRLGSAKFTFLSSTSYRTIEAVHPEIFARFTAPKLQTGEFVEGTDS